MPPRYNKYRYYAKTGKFDNTHLIKNYNAKTRMIDCCCEWVGHEDVFLDHQVNSPPTTNPAPPEMFPATAYDQSIIVAGTVTQMHWTERLQELVDKDPGYFDYVRSRTIRKVGEK